MRKKTLKKRVISLEHALGEILYRYSELSGKVRDLEEIVFDLDTVDIQLTTHGTNDSN